MLVFAQARLVFLSVPKTGSTAYAQALAPLATMVVSGPPQLKHAPLFRYNRFFRPMLEKFVAEDLDILAVMREPVSWLDSWYRYRGRAQLAGRRNSTQGMSFSDFVEAYCARDRPAFANVGSQARFLEPVGPGAVITHLFRYEDQDGLIRFLETRLQTRLSLRRSNVSSGQNHHLPDPIKQRLMAIARNDFDLWNGIARQGAYRPLTAPV